MPRSTIALVASLAVTAGLLVIPAAMSVATTGAVAADDLAGHSRSTTPTATDPVATAKRVLDGRATRRDPSPTLALRDVWLARGSLRGDARREVDAMLARPSDGANDPHGFGYTVPEAAPVCNTRLCVHYVPSTVDAPPSIDWVNQTLAVMDSVWTAEVDTLGYQAPLRDGKRGGGPTFDVYLKDLGGQIYGYCAPEAVRGKRRAAGFCVLDNDFSTLQFRLNDPLANLTVTAAHEFFHAVQFGYDAGEDGWMLESTATWMEERVATHINDSRQYLPVSQLYMPQFPLDTYHQNGYQYGNWVFWEYLSQKYGVNFVKRAWKKAGKRGGRLYSIQVLKRLLRSKGGLTKVYAKYANASLVPRLALPEGAEYPRPRVRTIKLGKRKGTELTRRVHHLSSRSVRFAPRSGVKKRWRLQVGVNGPARRTSPAVALLIQKRNGRFVQKTMRLNKRGNGRIRVSFDRRRITAVSVTLANVSTRYRCNRRNIFACRGVSLDDKQRFTLRVRTVR